MLTDFKHIFVCYRYDFIFNGYRMSDDLFGPALPPGYKLPADEESNKQHINPTDVTKGKSKLAASSEDSSSSSSSSDEDSSSERSPKKTKDSCAQAPRLLGPTLPAYLQVLDSDARPDNFIGPIIPGHLVKSSNDGDSSDDGMSFGPVPSKNPTIGATAVAEEIEMRAKSMKDKLLGKVRTKNNCLFVFCLFIIWF